MKKFTTLLILSALLLTACSAPASTGSSSEPTSAAGLETSASAESSTQTNTETNSEANADTNTQTPLQAPADITLSKYAVPTVYNEEFAEQYVGTLFEEDEKAPLGMYYFADTSDAVYYIYDCQHSFTMTTGFDIYRYDKASGENKLVKQLRFEIPSVMFSCINTDNTLYFSLYNENELWQICKFSFDDNTVTVLKEGSGDEESRIPCLSYTNGMLTWYTQHGDDINLVTFDPETRTETIVQNVISMNPYERAAGVAYAASENGKAVIYSDGKRIETDMSSKSFSLVAAQNGLIIWKTNYYGNPNDVYFLNTESGMKFTYSIEGFMGGGIIGRYFYVHTGGDKNVLFYDSADGKQYEITDVGTSWAYPISSDRLGTYSDGVLYIMRAE